MAEPLVPCPRCEGRMKTTGIGCGPMGPRIVVLDCFCCDGTGSISLEQAEEAKRGAEARKERIAQSRTIREEARRLGVSPSTLSMWELYGKRGAEWLTRDC